jgi:hypothetical protein
MKKIVTVTEVDGEGLEALLGQKVMLFSRSGSWSRSA